MAPKLRYLGTDVSEDLLDFARASCKRYDFRFLGVGSIVIPEADNVANMVAFFSVGTHLLHEEFFAYLDDARRVLKPGGRVVFSFLDLHSGSGRLVFAEMVRRLRAGEAPPHLDMFIGRDDLSVWADMLGMDLVETSPGDVVLPASERVRGVLGREPVISALGQSIAVFAKRR
jgi:SAM-dependent methyltransferase